jgi:hypothetical protein
MMRSIKFFIAKEAKKYVYWKRGYVVNPIEAHHCHRADPKPFREE